MKLNSTHTMGGDASSQDKTYAQKLKDPRWQKKRLKVLERDDWGCQICGCDNKTLDVHHIYYEKGKQPWEYPDDALVTYCEECHQEEHVSRYEQEMILLKVLRMMKLSSGDINSIACDLHESLIEGTLSAMDLVEIVFGATHFSGVTETMVKTVWEARKARFKKWLSDS